MPKSKRPKHFVERREFQLKLRQLAEDNLHEYLARDLGIPVTTLQNWLYRDLPPMQIVERLNEIVTLKWKERNGYAHNSRS